MKLQVIEYNGRVEFLPVRKPAELRGLLKRLKPVVDREPDREEVRTGKRFGRL
jgi:hypothetical protein